MAGYAWRHNHYEARGSLFAFVPLHGHDKMRFTVVLSAKGEPYVIFKGVRQVAELVATEGVVVAFSRYGNGWMNEQLTKDWVDRARGRLNFQRRFLVWDAYRCHVMSNVAAHATKATNTDISVIPGGLTSQLQPADVS